MKKFFYEAGAAGPGCPALSFASEEEAEREVGAAMPSYVGMAIRTCQLDGTSLDGTPGDEACPECGGDLVDWVVVVNLTPHAIHVLDVDGNRIREIPASGQIARCAEETIAAGEFGGLPLILRAYGTVTGLPVQDEETRYIVSQLVRLALPERRDLMSPGDVVRDSDGRIVGCLNFVVGE